MNPAPLVEMYIDKVFGAHRCEHVFHVAIADEVERDFRRIAGVIHPDKCNHPRAAEAMAQLNVFRDEALRKITDGTWGKDPPKPKVTIKTKLDEYHDVEPLAPGDLFDVYVGKSGRLHERKSVIKLLRDPRDEDLAQAEWKNLQMLWTAPKVTDNADTFRKYLPRPIETAKIAVGGKQRRANIFKLHEGRVSLRDVMDRYSSGIEPADMAWMFRRMLEALSWVHDNGIVHGAVLPQHVLIGTADHSAKLVDWSYSVPVGSKVKAVVSRWKDAYPPEVLAKLPASPATDLFMAASIAKALMGGYVVPPRISTLLDACLIASPHRRFSSAREVYRRFDTVLKDLYGQPKFRPFAM
jgi:serine/threonine protein kinase